MNGDGAVTTADASLIVQALVDRAAYDANAFTTSDGFLIDADLTGNVDGSAAFDLGLGIWSSSAASPPLREAARS